MEIINKVLSKTSKLSKIRDSPQPALNNLLTTLESSFDKISKLSDVIFSKFNLNAELTAATKIFFNTNIYLSSKFKHLLQIVLQNTDATVIAGNGVKAIENAAFTLGLAIQNLYAAFLHVTQVADNLATGITIVISKYIATLALIFETVLQITVYVLSSLTNLIQSLAHIKSNILVNISTAISYSLNVLTKAIATVSGSPKDIKHGKFFKLILSTIYTLYITYTNAINTISTNIGFVTSDKSIANLSNIFGNLYSGSIGHLASILNIINMQIYINTVTFKTVTKETVVSNVQSLTTIFKIAINTILEQITTITKSINVSFVPAIKSITDAILNVKTAILNLLQFLITLRYKTLRDVDIVKIQQLFVSVASAVNTLTIAFANFTRALGTHTNATGIKLISSISVIVTSLLQVVLNISSGVTNLLHNITGRSNEILTSIVSSFTIMVTNITNIIRKIPTLKSGKLLNIKDFFYTLTVTITTATKTLSADLKAIDEKANKIQPPLTGTIAQLASILSHIKIGSLGNLSKISFTAVISVDTASNALVKANKTNASLYLKKLITALENAFNSIIECLKKTKQNVDGKLIKQVNIFINALLSIQSQSTALLYIILNNPLNSSTVQQFNILLFNLLNSIEDLITVVSNVATFVITKTVSNVFYSITIASTTILQIIFSYISGVGGLLQSITGSKNIFISNVVSALSTLMTGVFANLKLITTNINIRIDGLNDIFRKISASLTMLILEFKSKVFKISTEQSELLSLSFDGALSTLVKGPIGFIITILQTITTSFSTILTSVRNGTIKSAEKNLHLILDYFRTSIKSLETVVSKMVLNAPSNLASLLSDLPTKLLRIKSLGISLLQTLIHSYASTLSTKSLTEIQIDGIEFTAAVQQFILEISVILKQIPHSTTTTTVHLTASLLALIGSIIELSYNIINVVCLLIHTIGGTDNQVFAKLLVTLASSLANITKLINSASFAITSNTSETYNSFLLSVEFTVGNIQTLLNTTITTTATSIGTTIGIIDHETSGNLLNVFTLFLTGSLANIGTSLGQIVNSITNTKNTFKVVTHGNVLQFVNNLFSLCDSSIKAISQNVQLILQTANQTLAPFVKAIIAAISTLQLSAQAIGSYLMKINVGTINNAEQQKLEYLFTKMAYSVELLIIAVNKYVNAAGGIVSLAVAQNVAVIISDLATILQIILSLSNRVSEIITRFAGHNSTVIINVSSIISNALSVLKRKLPGLLGISTNILSALSGIIKSLSNILSNIIVTFGDSYTKLLDLRINALPELLSILSQIPGIGYLFSKLHETVITDINFIANIFTKISSQTATNDINSVTVHIHNVFNVIVSVVPNIVALAPSSLTALLGTISTILSSLETNCVNLLNVLSSSIGTSISTAGEQTIKQYLPSVINTLRKFSDVIFKTLSTLVSIPSETTIQLVAALISLFNTVLQSVYNLINGINVTIKLETGSSEKVISDVSTSINTTITSVNQLLITALEPTAIATPPNIINFIQTAISISANSITALKTALTTLTTAIVPGNSGSLFNLINHALNGLTGGPLAKLAASLSIILSSMTQISIGFKDVTISNALSLLKNLFSVSKTSFDTILNNLQLIIGSVNAALVSPFKELRTYFKNVSVSLQTVITYLVGIDYSNIDSTVIQTIVNQFAHVIYNIVILIGGVIKLITAAGSVLSEPVGQVIVAVLAQFAISLNIVFTVAESVSTVVKKLSLNHIAVLKLDHLLLLLSTAASSVKNLLKDIVPGAGLGGQFNTLVGSLTKISVTISNGLSKLLGLLPNNLFTTLTLLTQIPNIASVIGQLINILTTNVQAIDTTFVNVTQQTAIATITSATTSATNALNSILSILPSITALAPTTLTILMKSFSVIVELFKSNLLDLLRNVSTFIGKRLSSSKLQATLLQLVNTLLQLFGVVSKVFSVAISIPATATAQFVVTFIALVNSLLQFVYKVFYGLSLSLKVVIGSETSSKVFSELTTTFAASITLINQFLITGSQELVTGTPQYISFIQSGISLADTVSTSLKNISKTLTTTIGTVTGNTLEMILPGLLAPLATTLSNAINTVKKSAASLNDVTPANALQLLNNIFSDVNKLFEYIQNNLNTLNYPSLKQLLKDVTTTFNGVHLSVQSIANYVITVYLKTTDSTVVAKLEHLFVQLGYTLKIFISAIYKFVTIAKGVISPKVGQITASIIAGFTTTLQTVFYVTNGISTLVQRLSGHKSSVVQNISAIVNAALSSLNSVLQKLSGLSAGNISSISLLLSEFGSIRSNVSAGLSKLPAVIPSSNNNSISNILSGLGQSSIKNIVNNVASALDSVTTVTNSLAKANANSVSVAVLTHLRTLVSGAFKSFTNSLTTIGSGDDPTNKNFLKTLADSVLTLDTQTNNLLTTVISVATTSLIRLTIKTIEIAVLKVASNVLDLLEITNKLVQTACKIMTTVIAQLLSSVVVVVSGIVDLVYNVVISINLLIKVQYGSPSETITNFINTLSGILLSLKTLLTSISSVLSDSTTSYTEFFTEIITKITVTITQITKYVTVTKTQLHVSTGSVTNSINEAVSALKDSTIGDVATQIDKAVSTISGATSSLSTVTKNSAQGVLQNVASAVGPAFDVFIITITTTITEYLSSSEQFVKHILHKISDDVKKVPPALNHLITITQSLIKTDINAQSADSALIKLANTLNELITNVRDLIKSVQTVSSSIIQVLSSVIVLVINVFQVVYNIISGLSYTITLCTGIVNAIFNGFLTTIYNTLNSLYSITVQLPSVLISQPSSYAPYLIQLISTYSTILTAYTTAIETLAKSVPTTTIPTSVSFTDALTDLNDNTIIGAFSITLGSLIKTIATLTDGLQSTAITYQQLPSIVSNLKDSILSVLTTISKSASSLAVQYNIDASTKSQYNAVINGISGIQSTFEEILNYILNVQETQSSNIDIENIENLSMKLVAIIQNFAVQVAKTCLATVYNLTQQSAAFSASLYLLLGVVGQISFNFFTGLFHLIKVLSGISSSRISGIASLLSEFLTSVADDIVSKISAALYGPLNKNNLFAFFSFSIKTLSKAANNLALKLTKLNPTNFRINQA